MLRLTSCIVLLLSLAVAVFFLPSVWASTQRVCVGGDETVVLLHGLGRTSRSMQPLAEYLNRQGYNTLNIDYPSTEHEIPELVEIAFAELQTPACEAQPAVHLHFVAHSMGGILVRYYLEHNDLPELSRVVLLSPPNRGSEVIDKIGDRAPVRWWNGPAGRQLGTGPDSMPNRLGPVDYPVGVITGNRSVNWYLSTLIPGEDDGKVSVERAKLEGMADFLVVPHTHPFIMRAAPVMRQAAHFLAHGRFSVGLGV